MKVTELTAAQMTDLKQKYLCEIDEFISLGELTMADEIVSDDAIIDLYAGTEFVDEDFFTNY